MKQQAIHYLTYISYSSPCTYASGYNSCPYPCPRVSPAPVCEASLISTIPIEMEIGSSENIVFVEVQENNRIREHEVMAAG